MNSDAPFTARAAFQNKTTDAIIIRAASRCGAAGGGIKGGVAYGATDDFSYNIVENPVHVRDLHATLLQLLGFDHQRLTFKWQGLDAKLTGVEPAKVVKAILA